jgi:hypothetical protein
MSTSNPNDLPADDAGLSKEFPPVHPAPENRLRRWLMFLLGAITAVIFIWLMLIVIYPSLALS